MGQTRWDEFNQTAAQPRQLAEVQQSKIQHIEQVQSRLNQRIERLREEQAGLTAVEGEENLAMLTEKLAELELIGEQLSEEGEQYGEQLVDKQTAVEDLRNQLDDVRGRLQSQKGPIGFA